jgi:hypothetical protein
MPYATIATNVAQPNHILGQLAPQRAFDNIIALQERSQTAQFTFFELPSLSLGIDPRLVA